MRIRSTKPEFWRSKTIATLDWEMVHNGPMPTGYRPYVGLAPAVTNAEYIYMFFDSDDSLIYAGRSWRPADRFTKHRRKPWWGQVSGLVLILVRGENREAAEIATQRFENAVLSAFSPPGNTAGPALSRMAI